MCATSVLFIQFSSIQKENSITPLFVNVMAIYQMGMDLRSTSINRSEIKSMTQKRNNIKELKEVY